MGIPDRVFSIAKGYLDKAAQRMQEIDAAAAQELDEYINSGRGNRGAWDRAQAKISAADSARELQDPADTPPDFGSTVTPGQQPAGPANNRGAGTPAVKSYGAPLMPIPPRDPSAPSSPSALNAAYRVLGVPTGSDINTVRDAYQKLIERAHPDRFPAGSPEQEQAREIERRASAAYMMLADALSPADDRFDRLEF